MANKKIILWVIVALLVIVVLGIICFLNFTNIPPSEGRVIVRYSGDQAMDIAECTDQSYVENTFYYIVEGKIEKVERNFNYIYSDFTIGEYIEGGPLEYDKIQIITDGGCVAGMCQGGEHSPVMDAGKKLLYITETNGEFRIGCDGIKSITNCTEEDNGYDLYNNATTKGFVYGGIFYKGTTLNEGYHEVEDYCYNYPSDNSLPEGTHLKEYLCEGGITFGDRVCTCKDGACVKPSSGINCTDTDGGKNILSKGKITGINEGENFRSEFEDMCSDDESLLLEGFCTTDLNYYSDWVLCEAGCEDGKCLEGIPNFLPTNWPLDKCYDSDNGHDYYIKGEVYGDYVGDVFKTFGVHRDACVSDDQLNEVFCLNATHTSSEAKRCPCSNGVCLN